MVRSQFVRLTGIAILAAAGLAAQAQTQQPAFKSAAIHVRVDVIATDKDDKPVTDLTAADFEIRQNGVLQTIADFEHVSIPVIDRKIDLKTVPPPPPDTFSNAPPPPNARAFVFVMWALAERNIVPIKRMMTSFISALQPEDEVAIVYAKRSDLSQDFTNDVGDLTRAVNNLKAAMGAGGFTDWLLTMNNVLQSLSAAREQRRVVVFVSEGLNLGVSPEVVALFRRAMQLNIPIYTMDPRGLMAPPLGLEGRMEDQVPAGAARMRAVETSKDGLRVIALNTNGRAFVNDWNVPESAAALIGENNSYYLLGFYPSPYEVDGKFHDIAVTVKRPGVKIRARQGYRSEAPPDPKAKPPQLINNLGAGLPGGDLRLRATAAPLSPSAKGANTLLTLDVEYPSGASGVDQLDLVWIAIDPDAKLRASGQNSVSVDLLGTSPRVTIHDAIDLPKGLLTIRVAVASRVTKTNGTVHVPVEVRDLSKTRLEVATLVLTRTPAPPAQLLEINNGLRLSPNTPTTARVFSKAERVRALARVFSPKGGSFETEMRLTLPTGDLRVVPVTRSEPKDVAGATDFTGDVPLSDLPVGKYMLAFTVRDTAGKRDPVQRATTFEVK